MKVKIGKFLFEANQTPIMLVLDAKDKANIAAMDSEANTFCAFPEGYNHKAVQNWMGDEHVVEIDAIKLQDLEKIEWEEFTGPGKRDMESGE